MPHTPFWPQDCLTPHIPAPADDPELVALQAALQPLSPLLRGFQFGRETFTEEGEAVSQLRALLCIGPQATLLSVVVRDDALILDLPIGDVPQRPEVLTVLLALNTGRVWTIRIDSSYEAGGESWAVLVLEAWARRTALDSLPDLVMEALMQRGLHQALLRRLRGGTDA